MEILITLLKFIGPDLFKKTISYIENLIIKRKKIRTNPIEIRSFSKGLLPFTEFDDLPSTQRNIISNNIINHILTSNNNFFAIVGSSGVGKTSIVQAGIFKSLKERNIKVSIIRSPSIDILNSSNSNIIDINDIRIKDLIENNQIIIIDQAEELLELKTNSKLYNNFQEIIIENIQDTKIIFTIRDDLFLELFSHIQELEPNKKDRFRLDDFSINEAVSIINEGCIKENITYVEDDLIRIISEISNNGKVKPIELQIIFEFIKDEVSYKNYQSKGGFAGILKNYVKNIIINSYNTNLSKRVLNVFYNHITKLKTEPILLIDIESKLANYSLTFKNEIRELVEYFVSQRILIDRVIKDKKYYQLAHDYLVGIIEVENNDFNTITEECNNKIRYHCNEFITSNKKSVLGYLKLRKLVSNSDLIISNEPLISKFIEESKKRFLMSCTLTCFIVIITLITLVYITTSKYCQSTPILIQSYSILNNRIYIGDSMYLFFNDNTFIDTSKNGKLYSVKINNVDTSLILEYSAIINDLEIEDDLENIFFKTKNNTITALSIDNLNLVRYNADKFFNLRNIHIVSCNSNKYIYFIDDFRNNNYVIKHNFYRYNLVTQLVDTFTISDDKNIGINHIYKIYEYNNKLIVNLTYRIFEDNDVIHFSNIIIYNDNINDKYYLFKEQHENGIINIQNVIGDKLFCTGDNTFTYNLINHEFEYHNYSRWPISNVRTIDKMIVGVLDPKKELYFVFQDSSIKNKELYMSDDKYVKLEILKNDSNIVFEINNELILNEKYKTSNRNNNFPFLYNKIDSTLYYYNGKDFLISYNIKNQTCYKIKIEFEGPVITNDNRYYDMDFSLDKRHIVFSYRYGPSLITIFSLDNRTQLHYYGEGEYYVKSPNLIYNYSNHNVSKIQKAYHNRLINKKFILHYFNN